MGEITPLGGRAAAHLCIDMQRLFAERTGWHAPGLERLVPNIARLTQAFRGRTVFARFTVPESAHHAPGSWHGFYRHWADVVDAMRETPGLVELMRPLAELASTETVLDKPTYSMFAGDELKKLLEEWKIDTVVLSGVETDVCVLATALDAVDLGYHVVVVSDAVDSASSEGHEAVLRVVLPRIPLQVEVMDTDGALASLQRT